MKVKITLYLPGGEMKEYTANSAETLIGSNYIKFVDYKTGNVITTSAPFIAERLCF